MSGAQHPEVIKRHYGVPNRGLALSGVSKVLRELGIENQVICFDTNRIEALPVPGIVLSRGGHYIALVKRVGGSRIRVFDPAVGSGIYRWSALRRILDGIGVQPLRTCTPTVTLGAPAPRRWRQLFVGVVSKRLAGRALSVYAIAQIIAWTIPLLSAKTVDSATGLIQSNGMLLLIGYLVVSVLGAALNAISNYFVAAVQASASVALADRVFNAIYEGVNEISSREPSSLFTRITTATRVQEFISGTAISAIFGCLTGVVALTMLFLTSPSLAAISLVGIGVVIAANSAFYRPMREAFEASFYAGSRYRSFLLDIFSSLDALQRSNGTSRIKTSHRRVVKTASIAQLGEHKVGGAQASFGALIVTFDRVVFALVCGSLVASGAISVGVFVALGLYREQLRVAVSRVQEGLQQLNSMHGQWDLIGPLLQTKPIRKRRCVEGGHIVVNNVTFQHNKFERDCLVDVSLQVEEGDFVALTGPSGCGKSTLMRIIAGELSGYSGSVSIGGVNAKLRPLGITTVLPSDRLISGTLAENIRFFRSDVSDDEVQDAIQESGLSEFMNEQPAGLGAFVSEHCAALSSGQRQRILLARALCKWTPVLLLDEATSHLDVELEAAILRRIKSSGRTILMIAHRPEACESANRIIDLRAPLDCQRSLRAA